MAKQDPQQASTGKCNDSVTAKNSNLQVSFVLTVIAVIDCSIIIIMTIITCLEESEKSKVPATEQSNAVCIDCIQETIHDNLVKRMVKGVRKCCAETYDQLLALLITAYRIRLAKSGHARPSSTHFRFSPISAHKQLLPSDTERLITEPQFNDGHNIPKIDHSHTDPLTEHVRGVDIENDSLIIKFPGLYYVYSNIDFRPVSKQRAGDLKYQSWFQYIHRHNPHDSMKSGVLLQTAHTVCNNCTDNHETAFSGGSFYLEKGDQIQVCFSSLGLVQFSKESTYVGVMMIASESQGDSRV